MQETILGILSAAFFGVFGWAFSLSNRVTKLETQYEGLETLLNTRFDAIDGRLDRIERSMNGHLRD